MPSCAVPGCTNSTKKISKSGVDISYHTFPSEYFGELKKKWIDFCARPPVFVNDSNEPWKPSSATRICSNHFGNDCFTTSPEACRKQRQLCSSFRRTIHRGTAVPTLNPPHATDDNAIAGTPSKQGMTEHINMGMSRRINLENELSTNNTNSLLCDSKIEIERASTITEPSVGTPRYLCFYPNKAGASDEERRARDRIPIRGRPRIRRNFKSARIKCNEIELNGVHVPTNDLTPPSTTQLQENLSKCSVLHCNNIQQNGPSAVIFHPLPHPSRPERATWMAFCQQDHSYWTDGIWVPVICSEHFDTNMYSEVQIINTESEAVQSSFVLKEDAIPTIPSPIMSDPTIQEPTIPSPTISVPKIIATSPVWVLCKVKVNPLAISSQCAAWDCPHTRINRPDMNFHCLPTDLSERSEYNTNLGYLPPSPVENVHELYLCAEHFLFQTASSLLANKPDNNYCIDSDNLTSSRSVESTEYAFEHALARQPIIDCLKSSLASLSNEYPPLDFPSIVEPTLEPFISPEQLFKPSNNEEPTLMLSCYKGRPLKPSSRLEPKSKPLYSDESTHLEHSFESAQPIFNVLPKIEPLPENILTAFKPTHSNLRLKPQAQNLEPELVSNFLEIMDDKPTLGRSPFRKILPKPEIPLTDNIKPALNYFRGSTTIDGVFLKMECTDYEPTDFTEEEIDYSMEFSREELAERVGSDHSYSLSIWSIYKKRPTKSSGKNSKPTKVKLWKDSFLKNRSHLSGKPRPLILLKAKLKPNKDSVGEIETEKTRDPKENNSDAEKTRNFDKENQAITDSTTNKKGSANINEFENESRNKNESETNNEIDNENEHELSDLYSDYKCESGPEFVDNKKDSDYNVDEESTSESEESITDDTEDEVEETNEVKAERHENQSFVVCHICGIRVQNRLVTRHNLTHQSGTCEICDKFFNNGYSLSKHIRRHNKEDRDKYRCEFCSKEFISKNAFKMHKIKWHSNDFFQCNECPIKFGSQGKLDRHIKSVHLNLRLYPCLQCDAAFKRSAALVIHMRIHTGEKPHKCNQEGCDYAGKQRHALNWHLKSNHGIHIVRKKEGRPRDDLDKMDEPIKRKKLKQRQYNYKLYDDSEAKQQSSDIENKKNERNFDIKIDLNEKNELSNMTKVKIESKPSEDTTSFLMGKLNKIEEFESRSDILDLENELESNSDILDLEQKCDSNSQHV